MPEPVITEFPHPQRLTIGETPVYLTSPLDVNGQPVTQLTIQGERTRGKNGIDSSVLLIKEKSRRRGEEGVAFSKPLVNVNAMEEVDWDKIEGIQYTNADGSIHTIHKEQLSLVKPEPEDLKRSHLAEQSETFPEPATSAVPEPKLARSILEKYSGEPTTLTIVGLKAYETRAHDLADKAMQLKTSLGERIWKQGLGPVYFHERLRQYYLEMLKVSNSPFAAESIKIAEAAGYNRYQDVLKNKNFLTRAGTRFSEWFKDSFGYRTMVQKFALEEIGHMKETGEIKERETFDREATSIRKRFEMDVENQDEYIRKNLGENIVLLDQPEHKPLVDEIKRVVRAYASGEIATKADFDIATDTLFQTHLKGAQPQLFEQAELYTSSLYEVAENLRTKASHEGGLAAIDAQLESMQVKLGMGVMGEATALEPTDVQRGSEMVRSLLTTLEKKGVTLLVNEATVSSGVALALSLIVLPKMAVSGFARTAGGFWGGAAVGALFGGIREYRQLEREYLTHLREREAGLTFSPDSKRRAWMERFFVGQRSADDLITAMNSGDAQTKLANLADAKARKALSSREHQRNAQRMGMIQYSGRENIETQRTALDLTIAQAEKDLLVSGKTNEQFLSDLTAAQTRVLNEGLEGLEGLDDPIRVTLGLLEKYNPQVEVMRRRFPLLGPEAATGEKAQGLEDILKEFRRAARGEAVRKGLVVGATGALIGLGVREGLQLGSEVISRLGESFPKPELPPVDVSTGQPFLFSHNLHLDGNNLVTPNPADPNKSFVVVEEFKKYLGEAHNAFSPDGTLSENAKQFIEAQARDHGYALQFPEAVKTSVEFSGNTHTLADIVAGQPVRAPTELNWMFTPEGRQLMLDFKDIHNNVFQTEIYHDAFHQGEPSGAMAAILQRPGLLPFTPGSPGGSIEHPGLFDSVRIPGLSDVIDTGGAAHPIIANIPDGATLLPQGLDPIEMKLLPPGEHVYMLVDAKGQAILHDIHITDTGRIINLDALNAGGEAHNNNLSISLDNLAPITTQEAGPLSDPFDKAVADMGGEHGASGPWGWLEDPINADGSISHHLPGTNLTKNLFRGFQENYLPTPEHANYTTLNPGDVYHNLPKALFEDGQLVKLGHIIDKAIGIQEDQGFDFDNITSADFAALGIKDQQEFEVLRAAYEIGRVGRVASDKEIQIFIDYLGGGTKETTVTIFQPTIRQMVSEVLPPTEPTITGIPTSVIWNQISLGERLPAPEIPIIPIPILWRRTLEPYKPLGPYTPPEVIPGPEPFPLLPRPEEENPAPFLVVPYGPEDGEYGRPYGPKYSNAEILAYYRKRRHPDLQADPDTRIDFTTAARWYIDQMPSHYQHALEALDQQIAVPMDDQARVAVCIPVAAHQEGRNIYHTLEQYTQQTMLDGASLPNNQYEIILFLNIPEGQTPDKTYSETKRFMADHPDMAVRVVTGSFPPGSVRFGAYTKYIYDLAMLRASKRTSPINSDLLIATADADLEAISPTYLATAIDSMSGTEGSRLDALLTLLDFDQRALDAYPTLKAATRFGQYVEHQMHSSDIPYIQTSGAVSILRASTLAAIGGVNPSTPAGADIEIGRMIHYARHGKLHGIPKKAYTIGYNGSVGIRTNARRQLITHLSGRSLIHTWDTFDEGENVRDKTTPELIAMATDKQKNLDTGDLEREINSYREWDVAMDSPETKQALSWMGLTEGTDYVVENDPSYTMKDESPAKRIRFTSDLSELKKRLLTLPAEPRMAKQQSEEQGMPQETQSPPIPQAPPNPPATSS